MDTIALRHLPALVPAHLGVLSLSGAVVGSVGRLAVIFAVIVLVVLVAVVFAVVRGLATLIAEFVQAATTITSLMFSAVVLIVLAAVMIVHH